MMQFDGMPPWVEGRMRAGRAKMRGVVPEREVDRMAEDLASLPEMDAAIRKVCIDAICGAIDSELQRFLKDGTLPDHPIPADDVDFTMARHYREARRLEVKPDLFFAEESTAGVEPDGPSLMPPIDMVQTIAARGGLGWQEEIVREGRDLRKRRTFVRPHDFLNDNVEVTTCAHAFSDCRCGFGDPQPAPVQPYVPLKELGSPGVFVGPGWKMHPYQSAAMDGQQKRPDAIAGLRFNGARYIPHATSADGASQSST